MSMTVRCGESWPALVAEWAMVILAALVAVDLADWAERGVVQPVAVAVELGLYKIFVPVDLVFCGESLGGGPGFGFDAKQGDVAGVILVFV